MWQTNHPFFQRYQIVPKLIFLSFGLQYFLVYNFRSIFFINAFAMKKDFYGNLYGVSMLIIFIVSMGLTFMIDKYKYSKRNVLICMVLCHMLTINLLFSKKFGNFGIQILLFSLLLFNYPQNSIVDKIMIDYLINRHMFSSYGNQKLWETVGFATSTYLQEYLGQLSGDDNEFNWRALNILTVIVSVCFITFLMIFIDPHQSDRPSNVRAADILKLFKSVKYLKFLLVSMLVGITRTGSSMYITNFYKDYLQLSNKDQYARMPQFLQYTFFMFESTPITIAVFACVAAEILLLFNTKRLIKSVGVYTLILIAITAQALRVMIYLFCGPDTEYKFMLVIIGEFLKGVNFGAFQPAGVILTEKLAPPEYKMLSQLCFSGMFNGLSFFISGLMFGWIFKDGFQASEFKIFFGLLILILLISAVLVFVFYYIMDRKLFVRTKYS